MKSNKIDKKLVAESSSGNVFSDLGLPDADKYLAKVKLADKVNNIIKDRGLRQKEAADILGIDQPKISALNCGRLDGFSIERLITLLNKLDRDVEIIVKPKPPRRKRRGYLRVAAT